MSRERWRAVARVEKTHGRRGEVVAVPVRGLPCLLREGLEVAPVPPTLDLPRRHLVARCSQGGRGQLVSFEGVRDLGVASALVGTTLLVRAHDLPTGWELRDADAVCGREVVDERLGSLGRVAEVLRGGANDVWVVRGERGEVLVPVVDEMVVATDAATGVVTTRVPVGLASWDKG